MAVSEQREKILLVDDDPANLRVAMEYLRAYSYEVLVARTGLKGIERATLAAPDMILLDVSMPGIDGYEVCRRLSANPATADIPVIFMSGLTEAGYTVKGLESGAVDYLRKPVDERELLTRVQVHLELRRLRRAEFQRRIALEAAAEVAQKQILQQEELLVQARGEAQTLRTQKLLNTGTLAAEGVGLAHSELVQTHVAAALASLDAGRPDLARTHLVIAVELGQPVPIESRPSPFEALSAREGQIVALLVAGRSNKEIAFELELARSTVSTHRERLFRKLGIRDLPSLVKLAVEHRFQG